MLQDLAVETALAGGLPCGWSAPTYKMLLEDWKNLSNVLAPVTARRNEQEKQLALVSGGVLDFWSLDNPDSVRGRKYKRFIVNEAAFVADLMGIWNNVIRSTLIDYEGDGYFAGTPKGRNGFWQMFMQGDWQHWQMPSYANPHIPKSELDSLKTTLTERAFQQEIMAQFLEDGGGVFRNVMKAAVLKEQEPIVGHTYLIGVDWARTNDATVFCVVDANTREQVKVDRMTNTDYATQRMRLKALAKRYNNASVMAEYNSMGGPQVEELQNQGMSVQAFTTTNASKAQIVQGLELAFEQGAIKILADETQTNELMAYESERLPSGLVRYSAPDGMHDDCVIALALAWRAISVGPVEAVDNPFYQ